MDVSKMNIVIGVIENALHDPSKPWTEPLGWVEARIGFDRFKILLSAVLIGSFYLIIGYGATLSSNTIGFVYPAYATLTLMDGMRQSMPTRAAVEATKRITIKWFTYWLTFTIILIAEHYFWFVLRLVPFYHLLKTIFLIWCFAPLKKNGANVMYSNIIRPFFDNQSYD